jgi:curli biogenesis system outer membrane secretion channel CsgG
MKFQLLPAAMLCFCVLVSVSAGATENAATPSGAAADNKKLNIAVTTIKNASGVTEGEVELLADRLRAELFNTGAVNVMEREQMQEILKEQGFQQSGACNDEACLVQMGQMLGVQKLVSGSL